MAGTSCSQGFHALSVSMPLAQSSGWMPAGTGFVRYERCQFRSAPMAENKWAREYLRALFGRSSDPTAGDDGEINAVEPASVIDDPLLELRFLRQGGMTAAECIKL